MEIRIDHDDIVMYISYNLKKIRAVKLLSQQDMAEVLKMGQPNYSRIEKCTRDIPLTGLYYLSTILKVNLNWVFDLSNTMESNFSIKAKGTIHQMDINDINKIISQKLYFIREKEKLSQNDMAEIVHTIQCNYSVVEQGVRQIKLEGIYTLCAEKKININWLFGLSDNMIAEDSANYHAMNLRLKERN